MIDALANFHFLRPAWLLLLPVALGFQRVSGGEGQRDEQEHTLHAGGAPFDSMRVPILPSPARSCRGPRPGAGRGLE